MYSFKNISSQERPAYLLCEDGRELATCIFSVNPPEILQISTFSSCNEELLVTLVRAVLNHLEMKGVRLVSSHGKGFSEILEKCGFKKETGEALYSLDLTGYFDSPCCGHES